MVLILHLVSRSDISDVYQRPAAVTTPAGRETGNVRRGAREDIG